MSAFWENNSSNKPTPTKDIASIRLWTRNGYRETRDSPVAERLRDIWRDSNTSRSRFTSVATPASVSVVDMSVIDSVLAENNYMSWSCGINFLTCVQRKSIGLFTCKVSITDLSPVISLISYRTPQFLLMSTPLSFSGGALMVDIPVGSSISSSSSRRASCETSLRKIWP